MEEVKRNILEDQEDIYANERQKGFLSFDFPYVCIGDNEDEKMYLNASNIAGLEETGEVNDQGVLNYYLTFYNVEEDPAVTELYPLSVKSSNQNEVAPLDWPLFSSCARIAFNRYILTGGVLLEPNYSSSFGEQFQLVLNSKEVLKEYQSYVSIIQGSLENTDIETKLKMAEIQNIAEKLGYNAPQNWNEGDKTSEEKEEKKDEDDDEEKKLKKNVNDLASFFQKQILSFNKRLALKQKKIDSKYTQENEIEIFNKYSPYVQSAILIQLDYNLDSQTYEFTGTYLENMPQGRSNHTSVFHKGSLYVIGGVSRQQALNSVLRYDIVSETWNQIPSLARPRFNATAVSFKDHIYVLGGYSECFNDSSVSINLLESINPSESGDKLAWQGLTLKTKMGWVPDFQAQLQLATSKDSLLLIGGLASKKDDMSNAANILEIIILNDKQWSYEPSGLTIAKRLQGSVVAKTSFLEHDEVFMVFGGQNQLSLEVISVEEKKQEAKTKLDLTKIINNDYTQEILSNNSFFQLSQPYLFID